ncbi:MAG: hydrogenase nickel incorporation protein HypB [Aeromicrobium sp.]
MCATCGCGTDEASVTTVGLEGEHHGHTHDHPHTHEHSHDHEHGDGQTHSHEHAFDELRTHTVEIEQLVLAKNDHLAEHNRQWLADRGVTAINLMSSPGAGKTTLLERTIKDVPASISVIEGDQETLFDAERIKAAGARAVQVNTGSGCHLDATMVQRALAQLDPADDSLVFIENVGNLVCPALFDLGERSKVVIISVTEGDDKPLKYPHMFAAADLVLLNKIDLLPYVDFDLDRLTRGARQVNPGIDILPVSARSGENLSDWYDWLSGVPREFNVIQVTPTS